MIGDDVQQIFERFREAAEAYFSDPGVLEGMELDERAGQLRRVCAGKLGDAALGSRLYDFQKRVRSDDRDGARDLLEELTPSLVKHGMA
jgi:hypothetical protein